MLKRLFAARKISLNIKIALLLVFALFASLGLASWLIYRDLRVYTYQQVSNSLNRVATTAALALNAQGADLNQDEIDPADLAKTKGLLNQIWKKNLFDNKERLARISLFKMDPSYNTWTCLVDLDGKSKIPPLSKPPSEAIETAIKAHTTTVLYQRNGATFSAAFASLSPAADKRPLILAIEYDTNHTEQALERKLQDILWAALLGLALTVVGAVVIAHHWTKPLRAFVQVMRLMQNTANYNLKIDLHPEDKEMSVVEHSFQRLIESVRDSRNKVEASYMATLKALVAALDVRDNDTAGHSLRVQRYALLIANAMRASEEQKLQVERGSLLHDIGKIGVPDAILHKKDRLSPEEWEIMKKHPLLGKNLVQGIEFLEAATQVIYCHHERWDGLGYPQALKGEEIPLAARIFAVADAFDTMTAGRVYRGERSIEEARQEIQRCAGAQFDPAVVRAFLIIPDSSFQRVRREVGREAIKPEAKAIFVEETTLSTTYGEL